jgi:hypothetical protein
MATSGTVSATTYPVQDIINQAVRLCKIPTPDITAENLLTAKQDLFLLFSSLANQGAPLWCIEKVILPMETNQIELKTPVGTVDIMNSNFRSLSRVAGGYSSSAGGVANYAFDEDYDTACIQTSVNGNISVNFGTEILITTVGIMPYGNQTYDLEFQRSDDAVTWVTVYAPGETDYLDKKWVWYDIDSNLAAQYFRVREIGGETLEIREFFVGNTPLEIPLARMNRDDYTNLPNKTFSSNRSLQFWFDRQRVQPTMYLWPAPNYAASFNQIVIWRQRQIQDVTNFTQEVDVPQRWLDAIVFSLAYRLALKLPNVAADLTVLKAEMREAMYYAQAEERDRSPVYFQANISPYTR